jgi:hypothetical protein
LLSSSLTDDPHAPFFGRCLDENGRHSSIGKADEASVVSNLPVPKEPGQHRQRVIRQRLVDKRLLPFERFHRAAGRQVIGSIKKWGYDLWKELANSRQPMAGLLIA